MTSFSPAPCGPGWNTSPPPGIDVVYGEAWWIGRAGGAVIRRYPTLPFDPKTLERDCFICQPAAFIRPLPTNVADWTRTSPGRSITISGSAWPSRTSALLRSRNTWPGSRMHSGSKTLYERDDVFHASMRLLKRHYGYVPFSWYSGTPRTAWTGATSSFSRCAPPC